MQAVDESSSVASATGNYAPCQGHGGGVGLRGLGWSMRGRVANVIVGTINSFNMQDIDRFDGSCARGDRARSVWLIFRCLRGARTGYGSRAGAQLDRLEKNIGDKYSAPRDTRLEERSRIMVMVDQRRGMA